jgi:4-hydroxybenzoate polyprenyltransferase
LKNLTLAAVSVQMIIFVAHEKIPVDMPIRYAANVNNYLSLVKFAHTIFALPFALIGYFIATRADGYAFSWNSLLLVVLCMVFARNAAMSFNRFADRMFDSQNPRTAGREIPAKVIKPSSALAFSMLNSLLFVVSTWFINRLCFWLSPLALVVILGYSYAKRYTAFSHFILGLGLSLAPAGAYLAVAGRFSLLPVILSLAVLLWVTGFDIIYALQDDEFDREQQLHSLPAALGRKWSLVLSAFLHALVGGLLFWVGLSRDFGLLFWAGYIIFGGLLVYQHLLVKPLDLSKVNMAFFTLNGIASLLFAVFTIADLFL